MKKLTALLVLTFTAAIAFAQGPLNPPGAPAPNMKSLQEIYDALPKPVRIPSLPYTITTNGAFYLDDDKTCTGAGQHGITIGAGVTSVIINFNGHIVSGARSSACRLSNAC